MKYFRQLLLITACMLTLSAAADDEFITVASTT